MLVLTFSSFVLINPETKEMGVFCSVYHRSLGFFFPLLQQKTAETAPTGVLYTQQSWAAQITLVSDSL
jgi:hypothetical protein